jgi:hypothetical protein
VAVQHGHVILDIGRSEDTLESFDLLPSSPM